MRQIVVISGKGGTGKTTVTSALARLVEGKVMVDADVDASNLEILTYPKTVHTEQYKEGQVAVIDPDKCISCDLCRQHCRFDAVMVSGSDYSIDEHACEGCKVCQLVCPVDAITMVDVEAGIVKRSETPFGTLYHGELSAGRDNSGKMVTYLRELGANEAQEKGLDWVLIDGAPGIGCQVIASLTGVDGAIVVSEPTLSAIHDLKRVVEVALHFRVKIGVVINKTDINPELSDGIRRWAESQNLPLLAEIPLDKRIIEAMVERKSPVEIGDENLTALYRQIWDKFVEAYFAQ